VTRAIAAVRRRDRLDGDRRTSSGFAGGENLGASPVAGGRANAGGAAGPLRAIRGERRAAAGAVLTHQQQESPMKRNPRKLNLHRQTVRSLDNVAAVLGGYGPLMSNDDTVCADSHRATCGNGTACYSKTC
jgi:hypothetical protein